MNEIARTVSSKTEKSVLKFVEKYYRKHGYAPSYQEIGDGIGKCKSQVFLAIKSLMMSGDIESDLKEAWHCPRAYRPKTWKEGRA